MARIRICLAVFTMVLFLIATSCSYADDMQETDNSFELTSIIEEYSEDSAAEVITTESATSIIPISREEAGLDPVMPIAELDESHIHPEIISASDLHRNLIQEWAWQDSWQILPDHYYQMGLEVSPEPQRDYIAVSKRWNGYIIGEITMQSTQADLLEALGEPGKKRAYDMNSGRQFFWSGSEDHGMYALFSDYDSQNDEIYNQQKELYENTKCWLWEYRTEQYYISFEGLAGSDTFDYVCFYKSPPLFDEKYQDILRVIIEDVIAYPDPNGTPIEDWENKWKGAEYLGGRNFAYGGRDIAYTTDGIVVEWIWGGRPNVYVYANFEGNLYQYQPDGEPAYIAAIHTVQPQTREY